MADSSPPAGSSSRDFELEVASLLRGPRVSVQHDVVVAGNQIDIVTEEEQTASGSRVRTIVECKDLKRPVGIAYVNAFAHIFRLLKGRGEADLAMMVSRSGFTQKARQAAAAHNVHLRVLDDLRAARNASAEFDETRSSVAVVDLPQHGAPFTRGRLISTVDGSIVKVF